MANDGTTLITRTLEYAANLKSHLRTSNRGRQYSYNGPSGKASLQWKAKYGYIFLDAMGIDVAMDGMNEKGLSFEALYLPTYAQYQTIPAGMENKAVSYLNLGDWILSNFDSIEDVRQALPNIFVYTQKLPELGEMVFPLHYAVYDASGKGIVIEYVEGKLSVYDNEIGVMTNSPTYPWQMTNLLNYMHLNSDNPTPINFNGKSYVAPGQGFGMVGLPGDITPPSRFVKMATLLRAALPAATANDALNLAQHIINNVDIPRGLVREEQKDGYAYEYTQWLVLKDLTHKIFYYRTYEDTTLRSVDISKLDFAEGKNRLNMDIAQNQYIQDKTHDFLI